MTVMNGTVMAAGAGDAGEGPREGSASARWALVALSLSMLLSSLGTSIANVGLPGIAQAFGASFAQAQWVVIAYLLAVTALIVGIGRIGDMVGRKRLLVGGLVLFTGASVLGALAPTLWLLVAARAVQGVGGAAMMALTLALVGETVARERTGAAMGLLGSMSAVGTALGPAIGGILLAWLGWRALFLVNLPLGAVAILAAHRFLPADRAPGADRPRFDALGMLLLAVTLGAYALAMTSGRGVVTIALLLAAGVGIGVFILVETRAASPLISLAILRDPVLSAGFAMSALVTTVIMATLVIGPFYLAGALALGPAAAGLVMSAGPVVAALAGVPGGRLVDRVGASWISAAGLAAMLAGCMLLSVIPLEAGVIGYVAPLAVVTAGYALFQAANNTAVMAGIGPDQRGAVSAMLTLSRNLGLVTGASAMGAVFAIASGVADAPLARPEAIAAGMRAAFAVAGLLVVAALLIALRSRVLKTLKPAFDA